MSSTISRIQTDVSCIVVESSRSSQGYYKICIYNMTYAGTYSPSNFESTLLPSFHASAESIRRLDLCWRTCHKKGCEVKLAYVLENACSIRKVSKTIDEGDAIVGFGNCIRNIYIYRVSRNSRLSYSIDDENEGKVKPVASETKLLGNARSRKGESHSGWNVVGGNDVVDTWKSGDTERGEKKRRRENEKTL